MFAVSLYGVSVAITWARDLPNRIVVDEAAVSATVGSLVIESYRYVLRDGDATTQVSVIRGQLIPYANSNPDAAKWILDEYGDDIRELALSDDLIVNSAATELSKSLNVRLETTPAQTGG